MAWAQENEDTGPTVLIVDDDFPTRYTLGKLLETKGYSVSGAATGREALEYLRRNAEPCLILLDLKMPDMSGWAFRMQQRGDPKLSAIPVVVCSGSRDAEQAAQHLGAEGHLVKPFNLDQVLAYVKQYCQ